MSGARWATRSLGFVLLGVLVASVGPGRLAAALADADPRWLALAAPGFLLFTWTKALRWFGLLRLAGLDYPLERSLAVYQASAFLAFVTPGRVGDLAKAAYLRRDLGTPWAAGLASTLADRALDLSVLAAAASLAWALAGPPGPLRTAWIVGLGALALAAPALVWPPLQRGALALLARLPGANGPARRVRVGLERLSGQLTRLGSPRLLLLAAVTALAFACLFAGAYALARGLRLPIGPLTTAYAVATASLVALLPVSVSGIGTRDAALLMLLAPHGVGTGQALSFSLAYLACSLLFSNGLGAWLWLRDPLAPAAEEAA